MSTSGAFEKDSVVVMGRLQFGILWVSAADLLAEAGLLKLRPDNGAMVHIEGGATLRGIKLLDYDDENGDEVDATVESTGCTAMITIASTTAAGISLIDDDPTMTPEHRIRVITAAGTGYANGAILLNPVILTQVPDADTPSNTRWRAPWSAP